MDSHLKSQKTWGGRMKEKDVEMYLVKRVREVGGKAYKFVSPGNIAVPDRICVLPKGNIVFVECKAPGKFPTPLQRKVIDSFHLLGHEVLVIDSKELVDTFLEVIKEEINDE